MFIVVLLVSILMIMLNVVIVDNVYQSATFFPNIFDIIISILFIIFIAVLDVTFISAVVTLIKLTA